MKKEKEVELKSSGKKENNQDSTPNEGEKQRGYKEKSLDSEAEPDRGEATPLITRSGQGGKERFSVDNDTEEQQPQGGKKRRGFLSSKRKNQRRSKPAAKNNDKKNAPQKAVRENDSDQEEVEEKDSSDNSGSASPEQDKERKGGKGQQSKNQRGSESIPDADFEESSSIFTLEGIFDAVNGLLLIFAIVSLQVLCVVYGMCRYPPSDPAVPDPAQGIVPVFFIFCLGVFPLGTFSIHSESPILIIINFAVELTSFLILLVYSSIFIHRTTSNSIRNGIESTWSNGGYSAAVTFYYETADELADQRYFDLMLLGTFGMVASFLLFFRSMFSMVKMKRHFIG